MPGNTVTRKEFIDSLEGKREFIIIEKSTKPQHNIKKLLEFIESIDLSRKDIENLGFSSEVINNILDTAKDFIDKNSRKVTYISEFKDYRNSIEDLMSILSAILPYNYYIVEEKNKILAKEIMPTYQR